MHENVFAIVKSCIDEINDQLEYDSLRDVAEKTALFGGNEALDSLSLVALIVAAEQELENEFGQQVALSDEKALSMSSSPYRTVGSLIDFVLSQLDASHG